MTEPTEEATTDSTTDSTGDSTYEAPDPFRRFTMPLLGWLFLALAIGDLAWLIRTAQTAGSSPVDLAMFGLSIAPSVAAVLIPAVLLLRHPDSTSRARTLLFGTILFAAVEGLQFLSQGLQPFFEGVTPASAELPTLVPMSVAYSGLTSLIASFGLLYVSVGLARARRYEGGSGILITLITPIAAILAAGSGLLTISQLPSQIAITPTVAVFLGAQLILGIVTVVAWAYLVVTTLRGVLAGEDPRFGWMLVSLGGALVLAAIALASIGTALGFQDATWSPVVRALTLGGYSFGHLFLLLAFVVGLPSLDEDGEEEEDDEGDDEDTTLAPDTDAEALGL